MSVPFHLPRRRNGAHKIVDCVSRQSDYYITKRRSGGAPEQTHDQRNYDRLKGFSRDLTILRRGLGLRYSRAVSEGGRGERKRARERIVPMRYYYPRGRDAHKDIFEKNNDSNNPPVGRSVFSFVPIFKTSLPLPRPPPPPAVAFRNRTGEGTVFGKDSSSSISISPSALSHLPSSSDCFPSLAPSTCQAGVDTRAQIFRGLPISTPGGEEYRSGRRRFETSTIRMGENLDLPPTFTRNCRITSIRNIRSVG